MAENNKNERILCLDVRSAKFGFAIFEGPNRVIDSGAKSYARRRGPLSTVLGGLFRKLVKLHSPSLVVFRLPPGHADKRNRRARLAARILRQEARRQSIPTRCLSRERIKTFYQARGLTNKQRIATYLSERFPELAWRMPPLRKKWQPEKHGMCVFDAAAAGASVG